MSPDNLVCPLIQPLISRYSMRPKFKDLLLSISVTNLYRVEVGFPQGDVLSSLMGGARF